MITGASSGIGRACAQRFAAAGADLVLWARRGDRLDAVASELRDTHGHSIVTAAVDVRERQAVNAAVESLVKAGNIPDILLNNAGLAAGMATVQEGDPDDWDRMIDTNLKGLLYVTRALVPHMIARGRGHIVNIGSTAGHQVYPKGNVYNATKFGVRALTEGMSLDFAGTPVKVSSIDPGFVETEFALVRFNGDAGKAKAVYEGFRPLSPDDVAEVVTYVVTLPEHMNILDLVLLPAAQRSVTVVDRRP